MSPIVLSQDILERLQVKSEETGVKPEEIVNKILDENLEEFNTKQIRLADKFSSLNSICESDESTDAVEIRDMIRERRI